MARIFSFLVSSIYAPPLRHFDNMQGCEQPELLHIFELIRLLKDADTIGPIYVSAELNLLSTLGQKQSGD